MEKIKSKILIKDNENFVEINMSNNQYQLDLSNANKFLIDLFAGMTREDLDKWFKNRTNGYKEGLIDLIKANNLKTITDNIQVEIK